MGIGKALLLIFSNRIILRRDLETPKHVGTTCEFRFCRKADWADDKGISTSRETKIAQLICPTRQINRASARSNREPESRRSCSAPAQLPSPLEIARVYRSAAIRASLMCKSRGPDHRCQESNPRMLHWPALGMSCWCRFQRCSAPTSKLQIIELVSDRYVSFGVGAS